MVHRATGGGVRRRRGHWLRCLSQLRPRVHRCKQIHRSKRLPRENSLSSRARSHSSSRARSPLHPTRKHRCAVCCSGCPAAIPARTRCQACGHGASWLPDAHLWGTREHGLCEVHRDGGLRRVWTRLACLRAWMQQLVGVLSRDDARAACCRVECGAHDGLHACRALCGSFPRLEANSACPPCRDCVPRPKEEGELRCSGVGELG